MVPMKRFVPITTLMAVFLVSGVAGWVSTFGRPPDRPPTPSPPGRRHSVAPELVRVAPGTIVGGTIPPGWSDCILRTILHLKSGDVDSLPELALDTATRFRTVLLADVRRVPNTQADYQLHRVGVGLTLIHQGRDTVVSSSTLNSLGVETSLLDKLVLKRAEQEMARGRLAARTPTFALYDAAVELAEGPRHRSIFLRYAMLVDRRSGRLQTVVWPIAANPSERVAPRQIILLEPSTVFQCGVHVLAHRTLGGVPYAWNFAMASLPPGRVLPMPQELRRWSIGEAKTPRDCTEIEGQIRRAIEERPASSRSQSTE